MRAALRSVLLAPKVLYVNPATGVAGRNGRSPGSAIAGSTAELAARIKPGMTVKLAAVATPLRSEFPDVYGYTISAFGATILGSEALPLAGATLVTGTRYKIATTLLGPGTGTTPAIWLYTNGIGYAAGAAWSILTRKSDNTATVGANEWALPGDGFLYFDIGGAPDSTHVIEFPQRNGTSIDKSNRRILGGTWYHARANIFQANQNAAYSGLEIGFVTAGRNSADVFNIANGTGTNNWIHDFTFEDTRNDGVGGGDGVGAHASSTGRIERGIFQRMGKQGVAVDEQGTWALHDCLFDAAAFEVTGTGVAAGRVTITRMRMMNEWATSVVGVHGFLINSGVHTAFIADINGLSIYRGTGTATNLRALRCQGVIDFRIHNAVCSSFGAAHPFSSGFSQSAGVFTESNCAAGGNDVDFFTWSGTNDITLVADPFNSSSTGDLSPKASLIGHGAGGVDIGYTAVAA